MKTLEVSQLNITRPSAKALLSSLCVAGILFGSLATPFVGTADAHKRHYNNGYYNRYDRDYRGNRPMFSYKTGKIVKGGLVGAGIGAGSAVVFDKPVLKSSLLGAGIGAGVQAIRYSDW